MKKQEGRGEQSEARATPRADADLGNFATKSRKTAIGPLDFREIRVICLNENIVRFLTSGSRSGG